MLGVFRNKPDIVGNTIINGTISDLRYTPSQNMYSSTWHIVFADGNWLLVACPATNVNAPHEVDAYTTDISLLKKIKIGHAYALIIKNGKLVDIQESSI